MREHGRHRGRGARQAYLPGLVKLRRLVDEGFFGRILSLRGEFGYWVFEGDGQEAQRPSWNYRKEDGGGIVVDMFCHWNYVLEGILGTVKTVNAQAVTHIPTRWDERVHAYDATADDAAYGIFEVRDPGGRPVVAQINSSWAVRVYRDELVEVQVDGTHGSAVAGLNKCVAQQRAHTPKPVWNPDLPVTESFRDQWVEVPANGDLDNGFKLQWEKFLRDVVAGRTHRFDLLSAARGVRWPSWACSRRRKAGVSTSHDHAVTTPTAPAEQAAPAEQSAPAAPPQADARSAPDAPSAPDARTAAAPRPIGRARRRDPTDLARLSLNTATTKQWTLREAVDGAVRAGLPAIGVWRDRVQEAGVTEAAKIIADAGLRVSSLCRGGFLTADDDTAATAALDDNRRAIVEAATLGTRELIMVVGGLPAASAPGGPALPGTGGRDIVGARQRVADRIGELAPFAAGHGVRLVLEPLHPIFAADRAVISTLGQALDIAEPYPADVVGVVVDTVPRVVGPGPAAADRPGGRVGPDRELPGVRLDAAAGGRRPAVPRPRG